MQGSTLSLRGSPSTCTAVGVLGSGTMQPRNGSGFECLEAFIEASHARGIVSGVQVKLLLELARELASASCRTDTSSQGCPPDQRAQCTADVASSPDSKPEQARSEPRQNTPPAAVHAPAAYVNDGSNSKLTAPAATSASTGHETGCGILQPQLYIQPLNLDSHLGSPNAGATNAAAVSGSLDTALQLQQALASSSTPFSNQASGLLGLSPALLAAVAAQAAAQQQQQVQVAQVPAACESPKAPAQQHTAVDVCTARPTTADVSTSAPVPVAAPTLVAGWGGCSSGVKAAAARKHRFTKDQQAAILESVERNYALYPSRYTELVIKEMQTRFPGIEINNACVRKIKFRANEAIKQVPTSTPAAPGGAAAAAETTSWMAGTPFERSDSQAAAEAARGLVGLAAAAAAVGGDPQQQQQQRQPVLSSALSSGEYSQTNNNPRDSIMPDKATLADDCTTSGPCAAAAAAALRPDLQPPPQQRQQGTESAVAIKAEQKQKQQQQQVPEEQQHQQASAGLNSAHAAGPFAACDDGAVDSATAAAVEAMHMLARCSSLPGPAVASTTGTGLLSATTAPPAGASLKRKLEERDGTIGLATMGLASDNSAAAAEQPTAMQTAEALAAAAGLVRCSSAQSAPAAAAIAGPQQAEVKVLSQGLQWPSAAAAQAATQPSLEQQLLRLQQLHQRQQQQRDTIRRCSPTPAAPGAAVPPNPSSVVPFSTVPAAAAAATTSAAITATAATARAASIPPAAKRQRLNGVQMAELVASVRHHVQVNPERYTHCVIKDMKEKYPELDINMGQIRKIKFRTLGNCNPRQASKCQPQQSSSCDPSASAAAAMQRPPTPSTGPEAGSTYRFPTLPVAAAPAAGATAPAAVTTSAAAALPPGFSWDASKALEAVAAAAAASMGFKAAPAAVAGLGLQQIQ